MSNANEPDRVNTGALATTIGIVTLSTLGIALFVTSLVRDQTRVLGGERQGTQERVVRELRADQLGALEASPSWKDRAAGVVTLPIERGMDWVVEAVRKNPKALSPWHPPAAENLGGAGPEAEAGTGSGTGGASAAGAPKSDLGATPAATTPTKAADAPVAPAAPAAPKKAPAPADAGTPAVP